MKKYIILSLFTISSAFTYTMENNSSFFDSFSIVSCLPFLPEWFSNSQCSKESLIISNLRKDVKAFEKHLLSYKVERVDDGRNAFFYGFARDDIKSRVAGRDHFVEYCYYYRYWKENTYWEINLKNLKGLSLNKPILNKCLNANINGYSALGSAIIAKDESFKERYILIQELTKYGFKPTQKDIGIAQLHLYDNIPKIFLHLIHQSSTASTVNWTILPKDIRLSIMRYIIQMFKNKFWLLPGFNS